MNEDGMNAIDSTEANDKVAMSDDDVKPNPASNISSLVIEEVEVSVPEMNLSDIGGENVSLYQNLYFSFGKIYRQLANILIFLIFHSQTLGSYTLVDGNTGQKLVDEKDIGNNESIRTEYEIEEVNVECEDPQ